MSTDTTNTSEFSEGPAGAADRDPVSDATGTEPAAAAGLPTVEWMARLANEFFATLPSTSGVQGMGGPVTAGHEPARSLEGSAGERVPLEGAAEPIWPKQADVPGLLSSLPPRAQVLSEADFRDLVQSVAGATGLLRAGPESGVTTPAPVATAAGVSERGGPWGGEPSFPSPGEMFAFPGVPSGIGPPAAVGGKGVGVDSVAGMEPKSRSGLTPHIELVQQNPFTTAAVSLPSTAELFSLPGVPGAVSPPAFPLAAPAAAPPARLPGQDEIWGMTRRGQAPGTPDFLGREGERNSVQSGGVGAESGPEAVPDIGLAKRPLNPELLRRDFPILQEQVHGRRLIWLDNAATTQKPNAVIDRLSHFYRHENSNIHRAAHTLAARATDAYEGAREKARRFLNASSTQEVIFVRGTTEGINLVAQSWGRRNVGKDDEVVITWLEHHANIVPWQQLCAEKGARLRVAPVNDRGEVIIEEYERLLNPRTRIVSLSHVSNALGSITPAREMTRMAHRHGARVLVDGAQAVSHMRTDVQALDCDFYVFSGHKVFGPTGIGVVYGKADVLETMPPWQGGGNMIADVTFERTVYQSPPAKFEAGTGNIADAVGLGAALDYVEQIGMEAIAAYEHDLLRYGTAALLTVPGLRLIGTAKEKASVLSFVLDGVRTEDVGVALNQQGIAVRSGHHCAQPILRRFGLETTVRPSLAFYNTCEEIDELVAALLRIKAGRGQ